MHPLTSVCICILPNEVRLILVNLRPLNPNDISQVARFHSSYIPYSTFAQLGIPFLKTLYQGFLNSDYGFVYTCWEGGKMQGFIAGTTDSQRLLRSLFRRHLFFLLLVSLKALFRRPRLLYPLFQTFHYPRRTDLPQTKAELLFIAVKPESRRKGIGHKLILKSLEELKRRGIDGVKVSVERKNQGTINLLKKMHFSQERKFSFYQRERILFSYRTPR